MNIRQKHLWDNLISLTQVNEAFYHQEFVRDGVRYWIFNYRLASYTDFLNPDALECRGTMFEVDANDQPVRLASWPQEKFFNLNENPSTIGLDLTKIVRVETKADGSLMSSYLHKGKLYLKSKGSLYSEQANHANEWLYRRENEALRAIVSIFTQTNCTVNLEWCAPQHRIVLGYTEPQLKILNIRDNTNGDYINIDDAYWFADHSVGKIAFDDPVKFVESVPAMTGVEGFVVTFEDGKRVKIKCDWYCSLHHTKDSINNPRRLFEAILDEAVDDLRSMFHDDAVAMALIDQMQLKVDHIYNHMVNAVETFYNAHKDDDRKTYAIAGQQDITLKYQSLSFFGLVMNKYLGKTVDYKDFLKSHWKDLGFRDTSLDKTAE